MNTPKLNLHDKKVAKSTSAEIAIFLYENSAILSNDIKLFYSDVKGFVDRQLTKCVSKRMTMSEILERSYNIQSYVLSSGAAGFEITFE